MAEPVTIGGQTFIKTGDGWVDQKSKIRAPEGLLSLLNRLQVENSSEGKKKRVRIDTSRPVVKLGKTEYVWDLNSGVWIDKKTKDAANPAFSKLIEAAYQSIVQGVTSNEQSYDKSEAANSVVNNMGSTGQAAKQRVTTRTGSGQLPAPNIKINSPIIQMIEKLATIDGYLKQRLDNQKKIANRNLIMAKEAAIEAKSSDASPVEQTSENDAEKSDATGIGVALLVGGLIAAQFEPVQEAFKSLASGIKSVFNFVGSVAKTIADGLDFFTGSSSTSNSSVEADSTAIPNITQGNTPSSPNIATPSLPGAPSETNEAASSVVAEASSSAPLAQPNISGSAKPMTTSSRSGVFGGGTGFNGGRASGKYDTPNATPSQSVARPKTTPALSATPSAPSATPSPSPVTNDPFAAYTGSAGKLSNDPAVRDKAFSTAPKTGAAPNANIIEVNHPETGNGFGIAGANDSNGRPLAFSREGAEAFAQMMQDSGGAVKPSDVASSKRSPSKNNEVGGATNSPHLRGVAMDIHGTSGAWIRQHGHRYNWRPHDYSGTHGGHFVFGGNGMVPDEGSSSAFERVVGAGVDLTEGAIKAVGNILSAALGHMSPTTGSQLQNSFNSTMSSDIGKAAREKTNAIVDSKIVESAATTIKSSSADTKASTSSSQMQIAESTGDNASIQYYLTRMGFAPLDYKQAAIV